MLGYSEENDDDDDEDNFGIHAQVMEEDKNFHQERDERAVEDFEKDYFQENFVIAAGMNDRYEHLQDLSRMAHQQLKEFY